MRPVLQALVVADHAYEDKTGKKIIAGTFNTLCFSKKSAVRGVEGPDGAEQQVIVGGMEAGSPFAYISLTDVCEGTTLKVQFVDLTRNLVCFGTELTIQEVERLSTIELILPLPRLPIRKAGTYALEVVCEGEILGSYRIIGRDLDEQSEGPNDGNS